MPSSASRVPSPEQAQRVHLDQRRVLLDEDVPQLLDDVLGLVGDLGGEAGRRDDLGGLRVVDADLRVDGHLGERVGVLVRDDLDLDTTLDAGDAQVVAVRAVDQEREVVLVLDVRRGGDQHPVDGEALDVHAEDVLGAGDGLLRVLGELDAAGLAASSGLDLGLDDDAPALLLGGCRGVLGLLDDGADRHRHVVLGEELLRLVLHQVHGYDRPLPGSLATALSPGTPFGPGRVTADISPVSGGPTIEGSVPFVTCLPLPHSSASGPATSRSRSASTARRVRDGRPWCSSTASPTSRTPGTPWSPTSLSTPGTW